MVCIRIIKVIMRGPRVTSGVLEGVLSFMGVTSGVSERVLSFSFSISYIIPGGFIEKL